jgi:predicted nuclease with TOPRIM domain
MSDDFDPMSKLKRDLEALGQSDREWLDKLQKDVSELKKSVPLIRKDVQGLRQDSLLGSGARNREAIEKLQHDVSDLRERVRHFESVVPLIETALFGGYGQRGSASCACGSSPCPYGRRG